VLDGARFKARARGADELKPFPTERVTQSVIRLGFGVPEAAGCAGRWRGLAILLAGGVLGIRCACAANPQPYEVDWISSGDKTIDSTLKLTSQLETLRKSAPVDPFGLIARARGDVTRLQTVLQSFGYYDGAITITINGRGLDSIGLGDALSALSKESDAHVRIDPTLGPLFHIGRIEIKGALPPGMRRKLPLAAGAPAVASDVLAAGSALQTALTDAGYAFAQVEKPVAYEEPARHVLNLTFPVTPGPRVRIGKIRIEGLKHVHESLVRRRLPVHGGERYDAAAIEKAREDLLTLGVLSTVSVTLGKPDSEERVPITFDVQEAKRYTVGVSAAYSSDLGGSGGVNWSDRDVFGGGQQLDLSATAINLGGSASTGLGYDAKLAYTIPDFRRREQSLSLSVEALRQELQAYAENGQITGALLSRKLSSLWSATAGLSYEHEVIGQPDATCPAPSGASGSVSGISLCDYSQIRTYELLLLPMTALYDSTALASPLEDPTHGFRISLYLTPTFSYSSSGTVFLVTEASLIHYLDLHELFARDPPGRTVFATKFMVGLDEGAVWYNLPPDERFYAGGSGTIRGYRYQSVGPQFQINGAPSGIPEGGTTIQVADLELRQRVGTNFGFVVFADGGGVSQSARPFSGTFRVGLGTGVRYYTSIGPIRFDVAFPTQRRASDDRFEIYIGLGQAF
jgi:translocation and assembly module TamA